MGRSPSPVALRLAVATEGDVRPGPSVVLRLTPKGGRHEMNLGDFIDTFKDAIAQRVVESYPPL